MKTSTAKARDLFSKSDELDRAKQRLTAIKNLFSTRKILRNGGREEAQTKFDEEIMSLFERGLIETSSPEVVWRCHDTAVQLIALTLEPAQLISCIDHFIILLKSGRLLDVPNEICKMLTDRFDAVRTSIIAHSTTGQMPVPQLLTSWREEVSGLIGSCYYFSELKVARRRAQGKALRWASQIAMMVLLVWSVVGNILLLDNGANVASLSWLFYVWGPGVWIGVAGLAGGVTAQGSSLIKEKPYLTSLANARSIHVLNITLGGILAIAVLYLVKSGMLFPNVLERLSGNTYDVELALGFVTGLLPSSISQLIENSIR